MKEKWIYGYLIILMIFSIANNYFGSMNLYIHKYYYLKIILWYSLGFFIMFILEKINNNYFLNKSKYLYILGNLLLIITLIFGVNINGSKSWLSLGSISFQASEFMKIALIFSLRNISLKNNISDLKYFLLTTIITLIPSILTFIEPDTGAVIIYIIIYFSFLFMRKLNKLYYISIFSLIIISIISFFSIYFTNQDLFINIFGSSLFYRVDRIINFVNNEGYQINMALTSISNSGLNGTSRYVYIPESSTDFAITLFIANFGIIGLILFLIVYFLFIKKLLSYKKDKYLLIPIVVILLFQYSINIFMNIGLFPIIGITLPFLSYGGSSLLSYFILIGFLKNYR